MHPGASGGPVFCPSGGVFGVNSTGFDDNDISYLSRINEIFQLFVENVSIDAGPPRTVHLIELARAGHIVVEPPFGPAPRRPIKD